MNRFSEAYIAFVTNSEAIQQLWHKRGVRVGDWYTYAGMEDIGRYIAHELNEPRENALWLPTLDDLVEQLWAKGIGDNSMPVDKHLAARLLERVLEEEGDETDGCTASDITKDG